MPRSAEGTRQQLISAAERLFAERGIESVSLREINRESGQRNTTALQYHFEGRAGLVRAIIEKHEPGIEHRRHTLLDEYEASDSPSVRDLASALVLPVAAKLADKGGGRDYLRIMAELLNRPDPRFDRAALEDSETSINRWRGLVAQWIPDLAVDRLHRRFTTLRIMFFELARRAESPQRRDDRLFVSHLIDLVAAILTAPLSDETTGLVRARKSR